MYVIEKNGRYVAESDVRKGDFYPTDDKSQAKRFSRNQAKKFLNNKRKSSSWLSGFNIVKEDGNVNSTVNANYNGMADKFVGSNDIFIDESLIYNVLGEARKFTVANLKDVSDIKGKKLILANYLSKIDCQLSDINHAILIYKRDRGKNAQAHRMAKLAYMISDLLEIRHDIKMSLRYIDTMLDIKQNNVSFADAVDRIEKSITDGEYKKRTSCFDVAMEILKN